MSGACAMRVSNRHVSELAGLLYQKGRRFIKQEAHSNEPVLVRRLGCQATATFDAKALKLPGFVSASGAT
jgi:hypothetical protein